MEVYSLNRGTNARSASVALSGIYSSCSAFIKHTFGKGMTLLMNNCKGSGLYLVINTKLCRLAINLAEGTNYNVY